MQEPIAYAFHQCVIPAHLKKAALAELTTFYRTWVLDSTHPEPSTDLPTLLQQIGLGARMRPDESIDITAFLRKHSDWEDAALITLGAFIQPGAVVICRRESDGLSGWTFDGTAAKTLERVQIASVMRRFRLQLPMVPPGLSAA